MAARKPQDPTTTLGTFKAAKTTKNFVRFETEVPEGERPLTMYVPNAVLDGMANPHTLEVLLRAV